MTDYVEDRKWRKKEKKIKIKMQKLREREERGRRKTGGRIKTLRMKRKVAIEGKKKKEWRRYNKTKEEY